MTSNQIPAIVLHTNKTQLVFLTTSTLSTCLRTIHFRSTPLYSPGSIYRWNLFPERSAPYLLNTAPSGGLQTPSEQPLW